MRRRSAHKRPDGVVVVRSLDSDAAPLRRGPLPDIWKMLRSAVGTFSLKVVSTGLGFGSTVVLARLLGRAGYGRYTIVAAWAALLGVPAVLGLDRVLVRDLVVYEAREQWDLMAGLLRRARHVVFAASALLAVIGCAVALLFLSPALRWPMCVGMALVPLAALTNLRQSGLQALGRMVSGQLPEFLLRPAIMLATFAAFLWLAPHTLTSTLAVAIAVVAAAAAFVMGAAMLRRGLPPAARTATPTYATRKWIRAAVPMMLVNGVWTANAYTSILVVGTLGGAREAAVYSIAEKAAAFVSLVLVATAYPLAPAAARLAASGDRAGLERTVERIAEISFAASIPVCAAFIALPHLYLGLFGTGFAAGAAPLVILSGGQLVNAAAGPSATVLVMTGHERVAARGMLVSFVVNLVVAVGLVPFLGASGGAIAFGISLAVLNLFFIVMARHRLGINVTAFRGLALVRRTSVPRPEA